MTFRFFQDIQNRKHHWWLVWKRNGGFGKRFQKKLDKRIHEIDKIPIKTKFLNRNMYFLFLAYSSSITKFWVLHKRCQECFPDFILVSFFCNNTSPAVTMYVKGTHSFKYLSWLHMSARPLETFEALVCHANQRSWSFACFLTFWKFFYIRCL